MSESLDLSEGHAFPPPSVSLMLGQKILFVVAEFPTQGTAGYHTYNRQVLSALLAQGADVYLHVLNPRYKKLSDSLADLPRAEVLRIDAPGLFRLRNTMHVIGPRALLGWCWRLLKPIFQRWMGRKLVSKEEIQIGRYISASQVRKVTHRVKHFKPSCVVVDTLFMTPLIPEIRGCPVLVVAHDVFHQRVANLERVGLRPQPAIVAAAETQQLNSAQAVLAISKTDARQFLTMGVTTPVQVLAPQVRMSKRMVEANTDSPQLFYMGSAAHHNVHALSWFLTAVWPLLQLRWPKIVLRVAGDAGASLSTILPGVVCLGRVSDPATAANGCIAAIDPVQAGSGVKIKILSYFAVGLPCLTTPAGASGLEDFASMLSIAEEPHEFVLALEALISRQAIQSRPIAEIDKGLTILRERSEEELAHFLLSVMETWNSRIAEA